MKRSIATTVKAIARSFTHVTNPTGAGFLAGGKFHPIRSWGGYDPARAGDPEKQKQHRPGTKAHAAASAKTAAVRKAAAAKAVATRTGKQVKQAERQLQSSGSIEAARANKKRLAAIEAKAMAARDRAEKLTPKKRRAGGLVTATEKELRSKAYRAFNQLARADINLNDATESGDYEGMVKWGDQADKAQAELNKVNAAAKPKDIGPFDETYFQTELDDKRATAERRWQVKHGHKGLSGSAKETAREKMIDAMGDISAYGGARARGRKNPTRRRRTTR